MARGVPIPLHLAVHLLGLTVALGLAAFGLGRRDDAGPGWLALVVGAVLLAASHAVAGGLVATALAWPVYLRAAGYAAVAVGGAGRLVGAAPVVIAAPPTAALAAAVAGAAAAVASFRGVLGRRRDAVVLAAGIALWAAADLASGSGAVAASALSVAGSATVGAWLVWRSRESLLSRIVVAFVGALLLLVLALASVGALVFRADLERDEAAALDEAAAARADQVEEDWTLAALTTAQLFAQDTLARRAGAADPASLQPLARSIAELPQVDLVLVVAPDGRVLASYDWGVVDAGPVPEGDALLLVGGAPVEAALGGGGDRGLVVLGGSELLAVGATPLFPVQGGEVRRDQQTGVLVVARRATDPVFLAEVSRTSSAAATVVIGGSASASTLEPEAAADVAAATRGADGAIVDVAGRPAFLGVGQLRSGVEPLGSLALTRDAEAVAGRERDLVRTVFLAALVGLGVAAVLAGWAAGRITRPVRVLTGSAEQVAAGGRDVRTGIDQPDEVGRLADVFDRMIGALGAREDELRTAAAVEGELRGRLEVLTTSMGEGLVAVGRDGTVQTINPAAERLLGIPAAAAVGAPAAEVLVGRDAAGTDLLRALGGPDATGVRAARGVVGAARRGGRGRDGRSPLAVAATAAPLQGAEGTHLGRVYVLRDVTGEAEVERMKTEFLANISHELRTPLTPIKGYAEVLRRRDVAPEQAAEFGDAIAAATERLERVIGMLVDFAALEAGRVDVRPEPTRLGGVVDRVLEVWREHEPDRRFSRRLASGLPPVLVDPVLLERALLELVDNAVKFSSGPVRIRAERDGAGDGRGRDGRGADGRVRLSVHDEGPGIDPDQLDSIQRDFHQLDGSATRSVGGLGLGLALVRRISERFGAELEIDSEPDGGTDVHLLLPVASGTATEVAK